MVIALMTFDPSKFTYEDMQKLFLEKGRKIRWDLKTPSGYTVDKEPINWTKSDHETFSGLYKEIEDQTWAVAEKRGLLDNLTKEEIDEWNPPIKRKGAKLKDTEEKMSNQWDKKEKKFDRKAKDKSFEVQMGKICNNCGLKIVHKAVQEWEVDHEYLGGTGTWCQKCVKEGSISSSLFPF